MQIRYVWVLVLLVPIALSIDPLLPVATNPLHFMSLTSFGDTLLNVCIPSFSSHLDWFYVV